MSLLNRAKRAAMENLSLAAQAAVDGSAHVKDRAVDLVDTVHAAIEAESLGDLPDALKYLQGNDTARLLLADAIAAAESTAVDGTTWDEILKAAIADLRTTPLGGAS